MKIDKQFSKMQLKQLLSENVLGALPSSKLMKMKWNPVTGKSSVKEANVAGTISPDEDEKMDKLIKVLEKEIATFNKKLQKHYKEADKIGGPFRSPGYHKRLDDILFGPKGAGKDRHPKLR